MQSRTCAANGSFCPTSIRKRYAFSAPACAWQTDGSCRSSARPMSCSRQAAITTSRSAAGSVCAMSSAAYSTRYTCSASCAPPSIASSIQFSICSYNALSILHPPRIKSDFPAETAVYKISRSRSGLREILCSFSSRSCCPSRYTYNPRTPSCRRAHLRNRPCCSSRPRAAPYRPA